MPRRWRSASPSASSAAAPAPRLRQSSAGASEPCRGVAEGDLSRAYVEWLSLLRHLVNAPDHPWRRWQALQAEAGRVLKRHDKTLRHLFHLDLPPLTHRQRHGKPKHHLLRV